MSSGIVSSLAIWARSKDGDFGNETPLIEKLHFNYWYLDCGKNDVPCLDIGILLSSFKSLSELMIWLPFQVAVDDVIDLAGSLKDASLLGAVFNDEYRVDSMEGKACYAHLPNRTESLNYADCAGFVLYELDVQSNISFRPFSGDRQLGTILSIAVETLHDLIKASDNGCGKRAYFRFRIKTHGLQEAFVFGRNYKWLDALLHDTLTATKLMDFRINQSRSLPKTLCEEVDSAGGFLPIAALHFLLLTKDTTVVSSDEHSTMRRLERDVWDCYLPDSKAPKPALSDDVIAYHWKQKGKLSADPSASTYAKAARRITSPFICWDVFIVLRFMHKSFRNLVVYLAFAILLGIASNVIAAALGF